MLEWLPYDQHASKPDLAEALVIFVVPGNGSKAITLLPSETAFAAPLKRVRPHKCAAPPLLEILVGPYPAPVPDSLAALAVHCEACGSSQARTLVPATPPYTREQTVIWSKYWPCAFKSPSVVPLQHTPEETKRIEARLAALPDTDTLIVHGQLQVEVQARDREDSPLHHSTMLALGLFSEAHGTEEQYYCTGAVVILKTEPCVMCAMAMVHSRVDRVYFQHTDPRGAFSRWKLHRQPLNYMYRIFQLPQS